ncbi:hypothetical protein HanRHA438_Chr09g0427751 [Helianthus annuus]|nr:hypothetical protein HanRHA438_Chr09g0427751 [Helianthus annuus]
MVEWYKVDKTNLTRNSFRPLAYIVPKRRRIAGIVVGPPSQLRNTFRITSHSCRNNRSFAGVHRNHHTQPKITNSLFRITIPFVLLEFSIFTRALLQEIATQPLMRKSRFEEMNRMT